MITLFHDYTSPASAVAVARAHRLQDEGLDIEIVGFEAVGVDLHVPVTLDVLAELDVVAEQAATEGMRLRRPRLLPPTGLAHVIERAVSGAAARMWRSAGYRAFWHDGRDLADPDELRAIAEEAGLDGSAIEDRLTDRLALAGVRRATSGHRRDGVGGVPTILAQRTLVPGLLGDDDLRALAAL